MPSPSAPIMGRALRGIYAGKHIRFGNNVSHSMQHTRRSWKPNVQQRYMESPVLGERVQVKVTTHALRCFAKAGGFDQWLLSSRHVKESLVATSLKRRIEEKLALDPSLTRPVPNVRMPKPPRAVTPSRL